MTKHRASKLKLPPDFLGTVQAFLNTPPPPKKAKRKEKPTRNRAVKPKVTK
jgi:hypothetical protein